LRQRPGHLARSGASPSPRALMLPSWLIGPRDNLNDDTSTDSFDIEEAARGGGGHNPITDAWSRAKACNTDVQNRGFLCRRVFASTGFHRPVSFKDAFRCSTLRVARQNCSPQRAFLTRRKPAPTRIRIPKRRPDTRTRAPTHAHTYHSHPTCYATRPPTISHTTSTPRAASPPSCTQTRHARHRQNTRSCEHPCTHLRAHTRTHAHAYTHTHLHHPPTHSRRQSRACVDLGAQHSYLGCVPQGRALRCSLPVGTVSCKLGRQGAQNCPNHLLCLFNVVCTVCFSGL
jgi:hypothetical protein